MKRGSTDEYERTAAGGEQVAAFIPNPLPPSPELVFMTARTQRLERATLTLGRLYSITLLLPDSNIFLYADYAPHQQIAPLHRPIPCR